MTDPFLRSSYDEEATPAARPVSRLDDLARKSGLPRAILDVVPAEAVEDYLTRVESWADLSAVLRRALEDAGFHRHDPWGAGGGFHIADHVRDDAILVSWSVRDDDPDAREPSEREKKIRAVMQPAIQVILTACGFAAEMIPDDQDNAGCVLVTRRALHAR